MRLSRRQATGSSHLYRRYNKPPACSALLPLQLFHCSGNDSAATPVPHTFPNKDSPRVGNAHTLAGTALAPNHNPHTRPQRQLHDAKQPAAGSCQASYTAPSAPHPAHDCSPLSHLPNVAPGSQWECSFAKATSHSLTHAHRNVTDAPQNTTNQAWLLLLRKRNAVGTWDHKIKGCEPLASCASHKRTVGPCIPVQTEHPKKKSICSPFPTGTPQPSHPPSDHQKQHPLTKQTTAPNSRQVLLGLRLRLLLRHTDM